MSRRVLLLSSTKRQHNLRRKGKSGSISSQVRVSFPILNNSSNAIVTVALSFANRDELVFNDMDVDHTDCELHDGWEDIGGDAGLYVPPPGEEGMLHSHAGGEIAFQQIFDSIHSQYVFSLSHFCFSTLYLTESEVTHVHGRIGYNSMSMLGVSNYLYW